MAWLISSELIGHLTVDVAHDVVVDSIKNDKLDINFDIHFTKLPCSVLTLNAMDASGNNHLNIKTNMKKIRLDQKGRELPDEIKKPKIQRPKDYCGDCYGAEDDKKKCCNTCAEVQDQYLKKGWAFRPEVITQCHEEGYVEEISKKNNEGCRLVGSIAVNKVQGLVNISPNTLSPDSNNIEAIRTKSFYDLTHTINVFSFGDHFPGRQNPLDRLRKRWIPGKTGSYQYYLKIVPTMYERTDGTQIITNQYSDQKSVV